LFVSARLLANGLTVVIHLLKWIGNDSYITYINYGPSNRSEIDVTGSTKLCNNNRAKDRPLQHNGLVRSVIYSIFAQKWIFSPTGESILVQIWTRPHGERAGLRPYRGWPTSSTAGLRPTLLALRASRVGTGQTTGQG